METLYRKVAVSERNPDNETIQYTSRGFLSYNKIFGWITIQNYTTRSPEWWLEEIQDNSHQIEKLEADKAELLEFMKELKDRFEYFNDKVSMSEIESLIKKHKQ